MDETSDPLDYSHLDLVPIEQLGLAVDTCNYLKDQTGMTNVGDLIDFYHHMRFAAVSVSHGVLKAMSTEVIEKLKEHDYWQYVQGYD